MFTKKCEFCGKEIKTKMRVKRFCNVFCQRKHYNRRPEIREKYRIRIREYRKAHPEWKEKHRIMAVTKYRKRRAEYQKKYGKRPEIRARIRKKEKLRRLNDPLFAIADRLRRSLHHALTKYSKLGKVMSSKKYGIDWRKVIENLEPFPKNLKDYEIDHVIPLHTFDLTDPEQVKVAFSPSNLQWLTIEENRKKSGKILKENNTINKIGLQINQGVKSGASMCTLQTNFA